MNSQLLENCDLLKQRSPEKTWVSVLEEPRPLKKDIDPRNILPQGILRDYLTQTSKDSAQQISYKRLAKGTLDFPDKGKWPNFLLLQKWEGFVLQVMKDSFVARLVDLIEEGADEEAEFSLEEISEDDLKLVTPGAIFYWNIGYQVSRSGQRTRISLIRFRRLPAWSATEIKEAKREAERIQKALKWK